MPMHGRRQQPGRLFTHRAGGGVVAAVCVWVATGRAHAGQPSHRRVGSLQAVSALPARAPIGLPGRPRGRGGVRAAALGTASCCGMPLPRPRDCGSQAGSVAIYARRAGRDTTPSPRPAPPLQVLRRKHLGASALRAHGQLPALVQPVLALEVRVCACTPPAPPLGQLVPLDRAHMPPHAVAASGGRTSARQVPAPACCTPPCPCPQSPPPPRAPGALSLPLKLAAAPPYASAGRTARPCCWAATTLMAPPCTCWSRQAWPTASMAQR
jgi:hypothetical protein